MTPGRARLVWPCERALRTVFMGTPPFAVPILEALAATTTLVGVVSQPDKPRGRGLTPLPSAVSATALRLGAPLIRPPKLRDPDVHARLLEWRPDLVVVAAYGKILPRSILDLPTLAPINVHASLLPRHRGAAPIAAALLAGEHETGVTIMLMREEMDAGDVLLQRALSIAGDETTETLTIRLAALGADALRDTLRLLRGPGLEPVAQDPALVSYAGRLTKDAGRIRWDEAAVVIERKVRAFAPWPSAFTLLGGKRVKILRARIHAGSPEAPAAVATPAPGTIIGLGDAITVAAGDGALDLLELQGEGKRPLPAAAFVSGARVAIGDRFDE